MLIVFWGLLALFLLTCYFFQNSCSFCKKTIDCFKNLFDFIFGEISLVEQKPEEVVVEEVAEAQTQPIEKAKKKPTKKKTAKKKSTKKKK